MIDFSLSEDQMLLVDMARDFAKNEIKPVAEDFHHNHTFPSEILKKAFDLGIVNMNLDQKYGGGGMSFLDGVMVAEILGHACPGIALTMMVNGMSVAPINVLGTDEQKEKWLNIIGHEKLLVSFALTEPQTGSDLAGLRTSYEKKGDQYVLNGTKAWISNASKAGLYIVFAYPKGSNQLAEMTAFIVPAGTPGVEPARPEKKLGLRASDTGMVSFTDVAIPLENRLGAEGSGSGFRGANAAFERGRTGTAAIATGIIQRCIDECIEYSRSRMSGGKPIGDHPVIRQYIATMEMAVEACRLTTWRAAWKGSLGKEFLYEASLAKAFATSHAEEMALKAVQIMASAGVSEEYPIAKLVNDAKVLCILEGTTEIQKFTLSEYLYTKGVPRYFL